MINSGKYNQVFEQNKKGRDFVIGDIHARLKKFIEALDSVDFDESKDRLFAVGDLIDGRKDNLKILDLLYKKEWFYSIRGNHEQLLINRYDFPGDIPCCSPEDAKKKTKWDAAQLHNYNGGSWFEKVRSDTARLRIKTLLKKLPLAITLETEHGSLGISHAGVPLEFKSWSDFLSALETDESVREECIWTRDVIGEFYDYYRKRPWEEGVPVEQRWLDGIDATVHGHTGVAEPISYNNQVFIDAASGSTKLNILEVSEVFRLVDNNNG